MRSKFIIIQNLKESLDAWRDQIKNRLEAVDALCFESADSLSPDQYAFLREKKNQLTADYDTVVRTVENIHGSEPTAVLSLAIYLVKVHNLLRLNVLASLLIEFSSKTSSLQSWMTHQTRVIGSIRERSADPQYLSERYAFSDLKICTCQVVDGNRHFDQVDQASRKLLNALDGLNAHTDVTSRHEIEAAERKKRSA
ncbi:hypothetical protein ANCCEY_05756 [Ancylostoma ceylanicum]|uniref:Uncharacterized protein n=1 Tax=Ancylostoma ceylanicum TaxID=53326 RepID=A0A0D6LSY3_9BILA|nr:hypothetical protein ANCCEY_05756 [Ancylostoma ceylanicum]